eukprot:TRINITY_DN3745_c0_g1_i4.p1 TRINITY_DN3745_c0_g1~~TRINITY_DN3745_c0_g1_i4.p1  ORF type:complete len:533 (+),score=216.95 TRINITY_DN3745_c0_g1_i4:240-1838(+)
MILSDLLLLLSVPMLPRDYTNDFGIEVLDGDSEEEEETFVAPNSKSQTPLPQQEDEEDLEKDKLLREQQEEEERQRREQEEEQRKQLLEEEEEKRKQEEEAKQREEAEKEKQRLLQEEEERRKREEEEREQLERLAKLERFLREKREEEKARQEKLKQEKEKEQQEKEREQEQIERERLEREQEENERLVREREQRKIEEAERKQQIEKEKQQREQIRIAKQEEEQEEQEEQKQEQAHSITKQTVLPQTVARREPSTVTAHQQSMANSREDAISFINHLSDFAAKSNIKLDIPTLLIVGAQSKGKSSLVEGLLGFPFNHTAQNIATKCPLYIRQEKAEEYESPMWWVENRLTPLTTSQVTEYIADHNKRLPTVSEIPLRLHVKFAKCLDLSFIDLPGVRTYGATEEEEAMVTQTKAILNSILKEMADRAIVVVVQKADDQVANFSTLAKVRDMVKKENIIVVLNMLDLLLNGHTPERDIITQLQEADSMLKGYPTFFTSFPDSVAKQEINLLNRSESERINVFRACTQRNRI